MSDSPNDHGVDLPESRGHYLPKVTPDSDLTESRSVPDAIPPMNSKEAAQHPSAQLLFSGVINALVGGIWLFFVFKMFDGQVDPPPLWKQTLLYGVGVCWIYSGVSRIRQAFAQVRRS